MRERGHTQCHCRRVICKCQSLACQGKSERERVEGGRRKEGESPMVEGGDRGEEYECASGLEETGKTWVWEESQKQSRS